MAGQQEHSAEISGTLGAELSSLGVQTGKVVEVRLSNELVGLLSAQLYQSPTKAIEELVVNAYDADASRCRVFVPAVGDTRDAIVVYDDGTGMDEEGLANLWHIGRSKKRDEEWQKRFRRKQIGKFGIGKLATYAVAWHVTYISKANGRVLSVTTDYREFKEDASGAGSRVQMPIAELRGDDAAGSDGFVQACAAIGCSVDELFSDTIPSWTLVILEGLKEPRISHGRLRWVLSTAMPLRSEFQLYLNGQEIRSSKEQLTAVVEFGIEELPKDRLDSLEAATGDSWTVADDALWSEAFPDGIRGSVVVTETSLYGGKSSDLARSHGFFVYVRGRLVNPRDALFGVHALSHATFSRFRADVSVDDLDHDLTASREDVGDSALKEKVQAVLLELFNEARERFDRRRRETEQDEERKREYERRYIAPRLVEYPIADVLIQTSRESEGPEADDSWFYIEPVAAEHLSAFIEGLYGHGEGNGRRYRYSYTNAGRSQRLVRLNLEQATFFINADHDLALAYHEEPHAQLLLEDLATAEAILEVYLRQGGLSPHTVGEILEQRDTLLRGLASEHVVSLSFISQSIRDAASRSHDLEVALVAAARALGFVAKHISGSGEPDGIARFTDYPQGEMVITLEAKASEHVPTLQQLDLAGVQEHMERYGARGSLLLAPAYPGTTLGNESALAVRATQAKISCWTVEQLARVVKEAEARHITAVDVLDIVLNRYAPDDVATAIDRLFEPDGADRKGLYRAIVEALEDLEGRLTDSARSMGHLEAEVTRNPEFARVPGSEIRRALAELAAASQGGLKLSNERIIATVALEELKRRVAPLTRQNGDPRRGGGFRE